MELWGELLAEWGEICYFSLDEGEREEVVLGVAQTYVVDVDQNEVDKIETDVEHLDDVGLCVGRMEILEEISEVRGCQRLGGCTFGHEKEAELPGK